MHLYMQCTVMYDRFQVTLNLKPDFQTNSARTVCLLDIFFIASRASPVKDCAANNSICVRTAPPAT